MIRRLVDFGVLRKFKTGTTVFALAWSAQSHFAVATQGGLVHVVADDLATPSIGKVADSPIQDLAWGVNRDVIYCVTESGRLVTLSVPELKGVSDKKPPGPDVGLLGIAVHPQGQGLATTQMFLSLHDALQLWGNNSQHKVAIPTPGLGPVEITFGAKGALLLTANMSASVDVRDSQTGDLLQRLEAPNSYMSMVAISDDRRFIAGGHPDGQQTIRVWRRVR